MLQIRLSRGSGSEGGGSKPSASENVTVSCPDYLVLADLPVVKTLGNVSSNNVNVVKIVGRRSRRQLGAKVHFCVRCNLPIAIYGRLSPCEHAFCLTCARSDSSCYLCDERIQKIQTIKMLEGIFICAAPHCLRSFLKRMDFELHITETHSDLFLPAVEKDEVHDKDVLNARPVTSDPQAKKPSHVQPQVLSHSPSTSSLQASQQHRHTSETQSLRSQPKAALMSSITSEQEREEKPQCNQAKGSSSAMQQQDQEQLSKPQTQQKQSGYHRQTHRQQDSQADSGDCLPQRYQENQQGLEKPHHQSLQEKHQRQSHVERHYTYAEKHEYEHSDKQHHQQQEKLDYEDIHQRNIEHQTLHGKQPTKQPMLKPANQPGMPPSFPALPFQHSHPIQPEGPLQQHYGPHYDPARSGAFIDGLPGQTGMQSFQDSNQRMPMQVPTLADVQEIHPTLWSVGSSGMPHEATPVVQGLQEGYMAADPQGQFLHFQGDYGQGLVSMPLPPPPHGMGMGLAHSVHYKDANNYPQMLPPPKRGKYLNVLGQGDGTTDMQNYGWQGGRASFGPTNG